MDKIVFLALDEHASDLCETLIRRQRFLTQNEGYSIFAYLFSMFFRFFSHLEAEDR
jgi:hypothetical protein